MPAREGINKGAHSHFPKIEVSHESTAGDCSRVGMGECRVSRVNAHSWHVREYTTFHVTTLTEIRTIGSHAFKLTSPAF